MTAITRTREARPEELKRVAAMPTGTNKPHLLLTQNFIPSEKPPIGTLMVEAILDQEYPPRQ